MKLGRLPQRLDSRTLRLAKYVSGVPSAPASRDWSNLAAKDWGMMQNDALGDCAIAAVGHAVQTWTANTGTEFTIPDGDIVAAYSGVSGYDPQLPETDRGCVMLDVLRYWQHNGIGGHVCGPYAILDTGSIQHVMAAINLFGGAYLGLAMPLSFQGADVWNVPPEDASGNGAPGSWGGHAVYALSYDLDGIKLVSWGKIYRMTWAAWQKYTEEAYAILSPDWVTGGIPAPSGFDLTALLEDVRALS